MFRVLMLHPHQCRRPVILSRQKKYPNICRFLSTVLADHDSPSSEQYDTTGSHASSLTVEEARHHAHMRRLRHIRNVGILAHVDAGKTTVTERMLALAGVVRRPGSVDDGNTVTDYLPAERERGITIQSAAISFDWCWHNHYTGDDFDPNDTVQVHLIDTPGHVDFSVEVNRSVAVLDGAVLVVDAVAGVQAQTETVWRAMTRPSLNNHDPTSSDHGHEPLPCLAFINKMDKDGRNFHYSMTTLKHKLPGANPIAMQLPLFRALGHSGSGSTLFDSNIITDDENGDFVGMVDLVHMRAVIYPSTTVTSSVEDNIPSVTSLLHPDTHQPVDPNCHVTKHAIKARAEFIAALANVDPAMEEYYLLEEEPTNAEVRAALRRATLARQALPVLCGAAFRGKGVEPVLDSIADLLPSPLDRMPPALTDLDDSTWTSSKGKGKRKGQAAPIPNAKTNDDNKMGLGHPLNPTLLALAFKVLHMKGRGGGGDGRVVFCRVYSGQLREKDTLQIISPPAPGELPSAPRTERVGGMLELAGGRFDTLTNGVCKSGDVCALIGLRSVVTGDTILIQSKGKKNIPVTNPVCLAGVASPKPVLQVRLEVETNEQQKRLSEALKLLVIEDPSLVVEETESVTLVSGLGELHIEVTLDRLLREYGLQVNTGKPAVAYRESITSPLETDGLLNYDRTIGTTRLQSAIHLKLEPTMVCTTPDSPCVLLSDPTVTLGPAVFEYLGLDPETDQEEATQLSDVANTLVMGAKGAMKRGALGSYALSNLNCHIEEISADGGLAAMQAMPGALRAAAAHAISETLATNKSNCVLVEPTMSMEITAPTEMVGMILSDLTGRRGTIGEVLMGDADQPKALIRGEVPLVEILGYANSLRSLTGGEGAFTAEYKGHAPCDQASVQ